MKRTMHMVDSSGNTEFIGSLALHVKKINFFLEKCVTYSPISEESGVIVPVQIWTDLLYSISVGSRIT